MKSGTESVSVATDLNKAQIVPVSKTSLSEQVAIQIAELVAKGHWKPTDKLPSEAELSKSFGISRPTVREALRSLAFVGIIEVRSGQGSYVVDTATALRNRLYEAGTTDAQARTADLTQARLIVEPEIAALCAQRISVAELQDVERLVAQLKVCKEEDDFIFADLQFHLALSTYSGSPIFSTLLHSVENSIEELIKNSTAFPGDANLTYKQHLKIIQALRDHNPQNARKAMRMHLKTFQSTCGLLSKAKPLHLDELNSER